MPELDSDLKHKQTPVFALTGAGPATINAQALHVHTDSVPADLISTHIKHMTHNASSSCSVALLLNPSERLPAVKVSTEEATLLRVGEKSIISGPDLLSPEALVSADECLPNSLFHPLNESAAVTRRDRLFFSSSHCSCCHSQDRNSLPGIHQAYPTTTPAQGKS